MAGAFLLLLLLAYFLLLLAGAFLLLLLLAYFLLLLAGALLLLLLLAHFLLLLAGALLLFLLLAYFLLLLLATGFFGLITLRHHWACWLRLLGPLRRGWLRGYQDFRLHRTFWQFWCNRL